MLSKEGVRPAMMVLTPATSSSPLPVAKDAPQAHPHPLVERLERGAVTVFEVLKPAPTDCVDSADDLSQADAVRALGVGTDRVLVLLQALLARPAIAALEVVPKEVEATRLVASTMRVLSG